MRKPILAGNWKMHKTAAEGVTLVEKIEEGAGSISEVEKVVCPPFTALPDVARALADVEIGVGAQDMYWEENGAYTGEISPLMAKEFCEYVIIGHSERREHFGETDETVNRKVRAAFSHELTPIVCVGETQELREAGKTETWVKDQVTKALAGLTAQQVARLILAYEPIWAIGTGLAATAEQAEAVCGPVIRATIKELYDEDTAEAVRIQYGGSIKPHNAEELMSQPNIDGGLVGGASLQAEDFVEIIRLTAKAKGLL
ncbi:MAG: triose-phosphate isomerase [Chloroflexota bacterium]|nr:triose-phosphate isomerase [Chloroflexota bacterium]